VKICRVSEIRELDERAQKEFLLTEEVLMENAGEAVYQLISREQGVKEKKFVMFCGPGNNGGDGFVVSRKIHSNGGRVRVYLLSKMGSYRKAARTNLERILKLGINVDEFNSVEDVREAVKSSDAIIDGIFGTGLVRNVKGLFRDTIELINSSHRRVFAIDIPSGINGDTGCEMGISVKADYTITFGLPKIGNLLFPGYGRSGELYLSHISYPPSLQNEDSIKVELNLGAKLPERNPNTTKFDYGPVLVIAGAPAYHWAPFASAYSFLKSGGGYVYLACPEFLAQSIAQAGREIVIQPQKETKSHTISLKNKAELLEKSKKMKMVIMGPGLSLNEETQQLARILAKEIEKPLLIDGDGITAIAKEPEIIKERRAPTILTPHTGEMARITSIERKEIENNRVDILQETTKRLNSIIVLKGPHTLIGYPDWTRTTPQRCCENGSIHPRTGRRPGSQRKWP
jgi:NAD(P)H-hydrate epimerase